MLMTRVHCDGALGRSGNNTMQLDDVLAILAAHHEQLRQRHVRTLAVFGSVARGEAGPDSDVDLLVEFDDGVPIGLFAFVRLQRYFEEILGRPVHLATPDSL